MVVTDACVGVAGGGVGALKATNIAMSAATETMTAPVPSGSRPVSKKEGRNIDGLPYVEWDAAASHL